ncbi:PrgI family protein [bacterium]|nr:MAG: PrgI family protein [bacterium]
MSINSHAVPQNIMDVEFKLFGKLTFRQFGIVFVGFVLAFLSYFFFKPIPILKWILVGFFVLLSWMVAVWKINGMSFESWLINYLIALFSTQRSVYKKSEKKRSIFDNLSDFNPLTKSSTNNLSDDNKNIFPQDNSQIITNVDVYETKELAKMDNLIASIFFTTNATNNSQTLSYANGYTQKVVHLARDGNQDLQKTDENAILVESNSPTDQYTSQNLVDKLDISKVRSNQKSFLTSSSVPSDEDIVLPTKEFLKESALRFIRAKKLEQK